MATVADGGTSPTSAGDAMLLLPGLLHASVRRVVAGEPPGVVAETDHGT